VTWFDWGIIILFVIIRLSGLLGYWQERGAGRAIAALARPPVEIKAEGLFWIGNEIQAVPISAISGGFRRRLALPVELVPATSIVLSSKWTLQLTTIFRPST